MDSDPDDPVAVAAISDAPVAMEQGTTIAARQTNIQINILIYIGTYLDFHMIFLSRSDFHYCILWLI